MSPVVIFDIISFLASITALIILFKNWSRTLKQDVKLLITGLLIFALFHHLSNVLEWSGLTNVLDTYEDYVEILVPFWWGIIFYAFLKELAARDIKESEDKYQDLFDNANDLIQSVSPDGHYLYVNKKWRETLGYDLEEIPNLLIWDVIHPDFIPHCNEIFQKVLSGEEVGIIEIVFVTKNGRQIWVEGNVNSRFEDGKPISSRGIFRDVTERKKTEEALRESGEKYRILFDSAADLIAVIDVGGHFLELNKKFEEESGYNRKEMIGKNVFSCGILTEESSVKALFHLENILKGKHWPIFEVEGIRKDCQIIPYELRAVPIKENGKIVAIQAILRNITDRKKAEEALRESEEKYRTVLEASPDPFIVYDKEEKVIYFNPAFTQVFGWTLEERLGKKMNLFVPENEWLKTGIMKEKILAGERFSGVETFRYTKNGAILPVSISGATYRDQSGNLLGSVINLRDISEQKKLVVQLQQAQKMEAMGTLAGGIAHDFNNILMGIQGRTALMQMDIDSSNPHFEHLKAIGDYVNSAAELTKQLLGFARGGKYEVKTTDLNEFIKKHNRMFGRTRKEITIRGTYEKNLWSVNVDQGQIEQVLMNIYVNALHAMPGGGELYIQSENTIVDENYVKPHQVEPGRYVKISITDTGVGMDKATQQRIFDPFFTTKEMGRGTGLGLASAYGIIKNHNGFINVYSEKGKGATFNIYLPASVKEAVKEEELHEELLKGTETLLLVDDEDMILDVGCRFIEKLGYKVFTAKSGKEAIKAFEMNQTEIDLVLLDMIMPEMGGGETFDRLKEINPAIKVLLSSGYSIDGQATEILERGCCGFIQKPFNIGELSQKIRMVLDQG